MPYKKKKGRQYGKQPEGHEFLPTTKYDHLEDRSAEFVGRMEESLPHWADYSEEERKADEWSRLFEAAYPEEKSAMVDPKAPNPPYPPLNMNSPSYDPSYSVATPLPPEVPTPPSYPPSRLPETEAERMERFGMMNASMANYRDDSKMSPEDIEAALFFQEAEQEPGTVSPSSWADDYFRLKTKGRF